MPFQRIGIIGLGLIGGSIAKTIRKRDTSIAIGVYDRQNLESAKEVVDELFESIEALANWAELVVIATPLKEVVLIAKQLAESKATCIVIDISSVKTPIVPVLEPLSTDRLEFVSTHPMAGREISGFEASTSTLFEGAPWIITPHSRNRSTSLEAVASWIRTLGGNPISLSPEEHDAQVALISHLPLMISQALLRFVQDENPQAISIAGPGFQSMVRLAKTPIALSSELMENNRAMITAYWKKWMQHLENIYGNA